MSKNMKKIASLKRKVNASLGDAVNSTREISGKIKNGTASVEERVKSFRDWIRAVKSTSELIELGVSRKEVMQIVEKYDPKKQSAKVNNGSSRSNK